MTIALAALLALAALATLEALVGSTLVGRLVDEPPATGADVPSLTIVVAARNEAEHIAPALSSLLAQDYPDLEIVAVDDRSDDDTGRILDGMAAADARLRVHHVTDLPAGWLGKNHALHVGAADARGEWLLFTDADVVFTPGALRRGVAAAARRGLDMLAVPPRVTSPSLAVRIFVAGFGLFFMLFTRPWLVRRSWSRAHIGIGAFNLLRTASYRRAGGHLPIRMRPDDDLMLGKLIKTSGGRCDVLMGAGDIEVAWYPSMPALVDGLMKNTFAGVGYRVSGTVFSVAGLMITGVAPFVIAAVAAGPLGIAAAAVCGLQLAAALRAARAVGLPAWLGLGLPLSALIFSWILVRATRADAPPGRHLLARHVLPARRTAPQRRLRRPPGPLTGIRQHGPRACLPKVATRAGDCTSSDIPGARAARIHQCNPLIRLVLPHVKLRTTGWRLTQLEH